MSEAFVFDAPIVPFGGSEACLAPARGVALLAVPHRDVVAAASNEMLVCLVDGWTPEHVDGLQTYVDSHEGRIVGQVPSLRILQLQFATNERVERALCELPLLAGVDLALPNAIAPSAGTSATYFARRRSR